MEQTKALNALAPFVALAKSATSPRQAADLVTQATSAQNTYVFAELLQTRAIQSLQNHAQYGSQYKVLELFTWGTLADYKATSPELPPLSAQQTQKLRLLTLLTLASTAASPSDLSYNSLQSRLSLSSSLELENLVTTAIYADLIDAKLDPARSMVQISSVAPLRDLPPKSIQSMISELDAWAARCQSAVDDLESRIEQVKREAEVRAKTEKEAAEERERAAEKWGGMVNKDGDGENMAAGAGSFGKGPAKGGKGKSVFSWGDGASDPMDVDSGGGGAKRKKGFFGRR